MANYSSWFSSWFGQGTARHENPEDSDEESPRSKFGIERPPVRSEDSESSSSSEEVSDDPPLNPHILAESKKPKGGGSGFRASSLKQVMK